VTPRNLLVVSYNHPPFPGPGGNRWVAMARYLREAGHSVTILASNAFGGLPDDDELDVVRVNDLKSSRLLRRLLRRGHLAPLSAPGDDAGLELPPPALLTKVLVPDAYLVSWLPAVVRAARRVVASREIDCLVTSGPPESVFLTGLLLGARRPAWIAEFRDGWSFEPLREPFPTAPQRTFDRWLEHRVAQTAEVAVGVTQPIVDDLARRLGARSEYVPNGWDPASAPGAVPAPEVAVATKTVRLDGPAEVTLVVTAACRDGSWARAGHEGAVLRVMIDGRYSQHLVVSRGAEPAPYRILLGSLDPGAHQAAVFVEQGNCGVSPDAVVVEDIVATAVPPGTADHRALAHSPFIHARAGTVARFSDIPLLMWYATEPSPRGTWIRYSVIFSNEDGGTPADRLMATWGRLTDIEYVYGVELDAAGQILAAEYQGPDHQFLPFAGERVGQHPVLFVVTENNMVSDRGVASERFALAPIPFEIEERSREVVMDTHPWLYRVSSEEAMREARVEAFPQPGRGKVPDPRRFVYVEACCRYLIHDFTGLAGID